MTCGDFRNRQEIECLLADGNGTYFYYQYEAIGWELKQKSHTAQFFVSDYTLKYPAPFCLDMDGDKDFDCLVGNENGRVFYYENVGTTSSTSGTGEYSFTADDFSPSTYFSTNAWDLFGVDGTTQNDLHSAPFCGDFDGDGDLDCIVGVKQSNSKTSNVHYFEYDNITRTFTWQTDDFFAGCFAPCVVTTSSRT